jgi:hypothetical protein
VKLGGELKMELDRIGTSMRWSALIMAFVGLYLAAPMIESGFEWKQCRDNTGVAILNGSTSISARCRELRGSIAIGVGLMGCSVVLGGLGNKLRKIGLRRRSEGGD